MTSDARMEPRPTAGALRITRPRSTEPPEGCAVYVDVTTSFCPYLGPSLRSGLTGWTVYGVDPDADPVDVEGAVFAAAVHAAEFVRVLAPRSRGHLACENAVFLGAGRQEIDWPHWVLKHLYAPAGLMVGKFWKGEEDTSWKGDPLPVPPVTFLSLRPAVRPRDPRFLDSTPVLADTIATSRDDGRDVLLPLIGEQTSATAAATHWATIKTWAASLQENR
ncbi:DUF6875 domain-containing protein [Kitasatospora sp. NPDC090091]|uniref:DUF6875 domain-containing protein n=1 Tax=Kitasatospora sp. NPDC090091 TaxID=3364081 RepID=UPI0037F7860D